LPPLACELPLITNWPICRPHPLRDRQTCCWIQVSPSNYWLWSAFRVRYTHCILDLKGLIVRFCVLTRWGGSCEYRSSEDVTPCSLVDVHGRFRGGPSAWVIRVLGTWWL
jgi:hypothetical protein